MERVCYVFSPNKLYGTSACPSCHDIYGHITESIKRGIRLRCKVLNVSVSVDKMQLLTHTSKTKYTHLYAMIRAHNFDPNIKLDFYGSVCYCMLSIDTSKSNSTFGTSSDKIS